MKKIRRAVRRWAYENDTFVRRGRQRRMLKMIELLRVPAGARIIDLGGTEYVWSLFEHDFRITLVNPKPTKPPRDARITALTADACDMRELFDDGAFDLAFSNSTIEHVGDLDRMEAFAREARRLGRAHWVQTPAKCFPIEVHSGIPFYWYLPRALQRYHESHHVDIVERSDFERMFPESRIHVERVLGWVKSYAAYRTFPGGKGADGTGAA